MMARRLPHTPSHRSILAVTSSNVTPRRDARALSPTLSHHAWQEDNAHAVTSLDMLDQSQQIMAALRLEAKKLREQNEQLKEEVFELKRVSTCCGQSVQTHLASCHTLLRAACGGQAQLPCAAAVVLQR
jgi:hypothetical protein